MFLDSKFTNIYQFLYKYNLKLFFLLNLKTIKNQNKSTFSLNEKNLVYYFKLVDYKTKNQWSHCRFNIVYISIAVLQYEISAID